MKKLLAALSGIILLLTSCQKEVSLEPNNSGGNNGVRLTRVGVRSGADSITTDYLYNNSNKLMGYTQAGTIYSKPIDMQFKLLRNSNDIITSVVIKSSAFQQSGLDSIVVSYTYDVANSRYKYSLYTAIAPGDTYTDSISYHYNAAGQLTSAVSWEEDGTGYVPYYKDEFTYAGANIATNKSYTYNDVSGQFDLEATSSFEYDTKINPFRFSSVEAVALGMLDFYSANNDTKVTFVSPDFPRPIVTNKTYTYNGNNRPVKGVHTTGGASAIYTYYYQ